MVLKTQIISLFFSFLYGIFFYILVSINHKYLFNSKIIFKIITSFLLVISNVFLYFIILRIINNGVVHIYFIFCIILGNYVCKMLYKLFVKKR